MIKYPIFLNKIFEKLHNNGAKCIIIGGFVRDSILNKKVQSKDIDIEVYNIASFDKLEEILKEFGSVNSFGKSFGVCKLSVENLDIDFTLPRIDSKTSSGHVGFDIKVESDLDYITATSRRDFTINAIGYDIQNKKIIDPFKGISDLKNRVLRAVDKNKFSDDPLRVLRAVQFCARFDLKMDEELFILCKNMIAKNVLSELPKERVFEEIKKLLLKANCPSDGFNLLKELGGLKYFSELDALQEEDWNEVLLTIDEVAKHKTTNKATNTVLMLSAVCYKFSEMATINFLSKLTNEKELLKKVLSLTLNTITRNQSHSELFRLATKVNIENLLILNRAIYINSNYELYKACDAIEKEAKKLNILDKKASPILRGRDILACGISASKEFSDILKTAYEAQMNEEFNSYDEAIRWLKNYLIF
ncbi:MAG: CCA tRNA nucleotidyltransferase [Campylobacterales bacterium]|nr:CCA tRNA nucleotidyltransferase [Campylobacterales bacterium]